MKLHKQLVVLMQLTYQQIGSFFTGNKLLYVLWDETMMISGDVFDRIKQKIIYRMNHRTKKPSNYFDFYCKKFYTTYAFFVLDLLIAKSLRFNPYFLSL